MIMTFINSSKELTYRDRLINLGLYFYGDHLINRASKVIFRFIL